MTHDEIRDLLGAFALDAVEPDEALIVEEHLETCPSCRAAVANERQVAAALVERRLPPPGLWDRIASQLTEVPPPLRLVSERRPGRGRVLRTASVAAALAAVAAVAALGWDVARLDSRIGRLQAEVSRVGIAQVAAVAALQPGNERVTLHSRAGGLVADVVLRPDGAAYVTTSSLPRLGGGRTYQLWGLSHARPVSLGLLGATAAPAAFRVGPSVTQLMITAEPSGGVSAPTTPVLVSAALRAS